MTTCEVKHRLWRTADQNGMSRDMLVQSRRNTQAAKHLPCKLLKRQCRAPRLMVTDKLASYGAAKRVIMPLVEHRKKGLNSRVENSHQPTLSKSLEIRRIDEKLSRLERTGTAAGHLCDRPRRPA